MRRQDARASPPPSHHAPTNIPVTRRLRRILLAVALVLFALYVLPQVAPVRSALLGLGTRALEGSGYTVRYGSSAGNLWRSLTLRNLEVTGRGADASAETVSVRYNLPALIGGKLPLSVSGSGLRGTLDLTKLLAGNTQAPEPDKPAGSTGRRGITPVLQDLSLSDVDLTLRGVPTYRAPVHITTLEVSKADEAFTFRAGLRVDGAQASLNGQATLAPFTLEADLERADVTLARPYFEGATGGTVSGTVNVRGSDVEADLELEGGTVDVVGITMQAVSGPVKLRDQKLTTELTGRALGGPLHGSGTVDLRAQHWQGDVRGSAGLAEALVWLGQGRLTPQTVANVLQAEGSAPVALRLGGWQTFTLAGSAFGQGSLVGKPLRDLDVDFTFATHEGTRTTATARLGGNPLSFVLEPNTEGFTMRANGTDLPLYGFASDVDLDLRSRGGTLTGGADVVLTRTALGRALRLNVAATTNGDIWQADLTGRDARGGRASGSITLRGSTLTSTLRATGLALPGLVTPLTLSAEAEGPLSTLPITAQFSGPEGVHPAAGGVRAEEDFSGTVRATLTGGSLEDIRGDLGPLELTGTLSDLRYSLESTRLSGRAQGSVALQGGQLTRESGTLNTTGTLRTTDLRVASLLLPNLGAAYGVSSDPLTVSLRDPDNGLRLALQGGRVTGSLKGTRLGALGETFAVTGDVSGRTSDLANSATLDLQAQSTGGGPRTTLQATGTGVDTRLSVTSEAGATLAGRTLGEALEVTGNVSLRERRAALTGTLGQVELDLDAGPDASGTLQTSARVGSGTDAFSADLSNLERWRTEGTLPLSDLGKALGLPLTGTLQSNLALHNGRYTGRATLTGEAFDLPLSVRARGSGRALELGADTAVAGQNVSLAGTLETRVDGAYLQANLSSPLATGPLEVGPEGLTGTLTLTPNQAALPDAHATLALRATPDLAWEADLQGGATLPYRDLRADLRGTLRGQGASYRGTGVLQVEGERVRLEGSGEGDQVQAQVTFDAVSLAPFAPVTGSLSGDMRLDIGDELRYFANLEASGEASNQPFDLTLRADKASGLNLNGTVAGTTLSLDSALPLRRVTLTLANAAQPFDFTAFASIGPRLSVQGAGAWRGEALSVFGNFTPRTGTGRVQVGLGDAALTTTLQTRDGIRSVRANLDAPQGLLTLTRPLSARVQADLGPSTTLRTLSVSFGTNRLELAGTLRPETELSGQLVVPTAQLAPQDRPVALSLVPLDSSYLLTLEQDNLTLRGVLGPSFRPERVRLIGRQTRDLGGRTLRLESNLVWQEGRGFSGKSVLELSGTASVTLTLTGGGDDTDGSEGIALTGLRVRGTGQYRDVQVAALDARLSAAPWRDRTLAGTLELNAPVNRLVPGWPGEALALTGDLALAGTLTDPNVEGPLNLTGALTATGNLAATREGGTVTLAGPGLELTGSVDTTGYDSNLQLSALDLGRVLPRFVSAQAAPRRDPPTLSLAARATQRWGSGPDVRMSGLDFRSARSTLRGHARYGDGYVADLELDTNLADFSAALKGRVRGPLTLDSRHPLGESLTLTGLGPAGADWALDGRLGLMGSPSAPTLALALRGSGSARGQLEGNVSPVDRTFDLSSTLKVAGLSSDLALARTEDGLSGAGSLAFRDFGMTLRTWGRGLEWHGQDRLGGWQGRYSDAGLNLGGPLAALSPQLGGTLSLSSTATLHRVRGTLTNVTAGPVTLGNVALHETVKDGARALNLTGSALAGHVGLSGTLPWQLERLALSLPGNVTLSGSGNGTRSVGALAATLEAASFSFPVTASYAPGGLALAARGGLPVGILTLDARYSGAAWQGALNLTDDGAAPLLTGQLSGTLGNPKLAGHVDLAQGENSVKGTFSASRDALGLDTRLASPQLATPLSLKAAGWPLELTLKNQTQTLKLALQDGRLVPSGTLNLRAGPATLRLRALDDGLGLRLAAPAAPGLILHTTLPARLSAYGELLDGLKLTGTGKTRGTLTLALRPDPQVQVNDLRWASPAGRLTLGGSMGLSGGLEARLQGRWNGSATASLPWLREATFPFTLNAAEGHIRLDSKGDPGTLRVDLALAERRGTLVSNLELGRGRLESNLSYAPGTGPVGTLTITTLTLFSTEDAPATLSTTLALTPSGLSGNGFLRYAGSSAELSGQAGWARVLPVALRRYTPQAGETLAAQVRLNRLELGDLPPLAARVPYLSAPVSGVATLTGSQIVGQLIAPELAVLGTALPTQVDFNGTLSRLEARATIGESRLNLAYDRAPGNSRLAGLLTLESFPLQVLAEATTGASQVEASATGAARFDLPLANLRASYVRLATERVTLRSNAAGSSETTTEGNVALRFENGSLYVERATFEGDGSWRADGILTPDTLDFTFDADDADFSPLLRLVPRLASFGIGARGSVELRAAGSAADPDISLTSSGLEVSVAGGNYRAFPLEVTLKSGVFNLESSVTGLSPIGGTVALRGSGEVGLNPFRTRDLALRFSGNASVPTLGNVTALRGRIYPSTAGLQLNGRGAIGKPFTVTGTLAPLNLHLRGQELNIRAPRYFLASSSTNADVRVRLNDNSIDVLGNLVVTTAQLSLERGQSSTPANLQSNTQDDTGEDIQTGNAETPGTEAESANNEPNDAESGATESDTATVTTAESLSSVLTQQTNPALARIRFADVRLRSPGQVFFESGFGNAELAFDVTLTGTAATPQLRGEARTLQGTVNFSGQDFTVTQASATFDPTQGVFPSLDLDAEVTFDKAQALGNLQTEGYDLVEPTGSTFLAQLQIKGAFRRSASGKRTLDLEPTLSSNAVLQVDANNPRSLNETELLTLLTLGRLQLDAPIVGTNGLAETVATTALDTAVDLYLVSELQNALSDVLGVNLEIRTSSLSSVLGPDPQEFGVSVKLGGYLSDNLFASVQVGRFDDPDQAYALTNEFSLRYTANPLEINLAGGVNFADTSDGSLSTVTDFSLGFSYALTSRLSLDASLATQDSGNDTNFGFGISYTW